ncbi:SigE family RNA polymerase sigma factor [Ornithinimicrobium cerasi]|uniref:SigE family RNA polymerase sigma factor n=1 Tax=Ornithinimicrobium cerasi TaxID=2248773 RepID=UPI001F24B1BA|nr:SigE family RNA polymerase sigma factor [Ornithinimicrobium cerasi]
MDAYGTATSAVPENAATGFDEYVVSRASDLVRTAFFLTGDRQTAEDLVQTALAKVWPRWRQISECGEPHAYVRRVMTTTYLAWWRRRWNGERPVDALPEPEPLVDRRSADRLDLLRALAQLPRGQRAAVVLRHVEDLSEARTAEIMGCSVGTVKSQCSRGLAALRRNPLLAEDGDLR